MWLRQVIFINEKNSIQVRINGDKHPIGHTLAVLHFDLAKIQKILFYGKEIHLKK
jgi:hypothetical protein